jgi:hypothetical protein
LRPDDGVICCCGEELGRRPGEGGVVVSQQVNEGELVADTLKCVRKGFNMDLNGRGYLR